MEMFGHAIVLIWATIAGYLNAGTPKQWPVYIFISIPLITGVYFLGWWSLFSFGIGIALGGHMYREAEISQKRKT